MKYTNFDKQVIHILPGYKLPYFRPQNVLSLNSISYCSLRHLMFFESFSCIVLIKYKDLLCMSNLERFVFLTREVHRDFVKSHFLMYLAELYAETGLPSTPPQPGIDCTHLHSTFFAFIATFLLFLFGCPHFFSH